MMLSHKKIIVVSCILIFGLIITLLYVEKNTFRTATPQAGDYLVYAVTSFDGGNRKSDLIFYDLFQHTHVPILAGWNIHNISLSGDHVAISSSHTSAPAVYVLEYPFVDKKPIHVEHENPGDYYRMAWSPDGHYLAYVSEFDGGANLFIWDGTDSTLIAQSPSGIGDMAWSPDNRLAFITFYSSVSPYEGDMTEAFIWDGEDVVNLSQNDTGEDRHPAWSPDGRLAFVSERNERYGLFIWDGISMINGLPDVNTFKEIAPGLTSYQSSPTWINSEHLTFTGYNMKQYEHLPIYKWDGTTATNISQNPSCHSGGPRSHNNGYWSFGTFLSCEQLVYIRNEADETKLTMEGYGVRWSESGYFFFCQRNIVGSHWHFEKWEIPKIIIDYDGWSLQLGDGNKLTEVVDGDIVLAASANGELAYCSY